MVKTHYSLIRLIFIPIIGYIFVAYFLGVNSDDLHYYTSKIKEFLSAGLSDSPKNIFAKLGIDITSQKFWHNGLDEVETLLDETWKLGEKLGKI